LIKKLLAIQTKSVSFASLILAGSYLLSALLGLLRDRLLAGRFGAGNELDMYYSAFTVPDFIALILVFGAISAAIIPIFNSYVIHSKQEAWRYLSILLTTFLTFLIIVSVILIIAAPFLINIIAPGFSPEKKETTVMLMRIMFLSPIILGVSSIISGILQVFHRFLVTALAPIMYNLGIITGIIFFVPIFGLKGLAFGVVLGAVLHLLIQIPAFLYSGFTYQPKIDFGHPGVKKTFILMVPRSLGLGAGQFNAIVITAIASTLATGSIAIFNLANTLSSILINAISISLSTAIFPALSSAYSNFASAKSSKEAREYKKSFERKFSAGFLQILFLSIPVSIGIFLLRAQIVRVILGTGKFTWMDTRLTAACLGIFSLGLCAQGLIFLLSKTFYAAHNTKIPAIISVATVLCNITMSITFVWLLGFTNGFSSFLHAIIKLQSIQNISIVGLSLAFTITAICEALLLVFFIHKKLGIFNIRQVLVSVGKMFISGMVMAVVLLSARQLLVQFNIVQLQAFWGVFLQLAVSGGLGLVAYVATALILKSPEIHMIGESFFKRFLRTLN